MSLLEVLRQFIMRKRSKALESEEKALGKSLEALEKTDQALENRDTKFEEFQLGVAAGYTGRFIKEIESSLQRIESQMVTKDWFLSSFEDKAPELLSFIRLHEEEEKKRFETIVNLLHALQKDTGRIAEPTKSEETIKSFQPQQSQQLPLTQKMEGLILVVKEFGEISYQDLALKLGISVSGLRGLLTQTLRRTSKIERFVRNGKGWVRYKGD
jgi:hypothetical protein